MGKESWKIDQYFLQISHIIFFVHPLHPQVKSKLCNSVILLLNYTYPGKRFIDIPSSFWVLPLIAKQETDWPFLFCFILFLKYKTQMYSKISRKKYYILANEPYLFMYEYTIKTQVDTNYSPKRDIITIKKHGNMYMSRALI